MRIVTESNEWKALRKTLRDVTLGFVATMGNLHEGHLALCRQSIRENDKTVVSVFVNPTQFNDTNDFTHYPRTWEHDHALLSSLDVDYVFLPSPSDMYADKYEVQVSEIALSSVLEGEHRPGHFTGMLTVVLKLLNLMQATHAYFGEKDYQQYLLVKKMVDALFLSTRIVACPTVRANDGLALSSRNARLSEVAREKAAEFPRLLHSSLSCSDIENALTQQGFIVEYITECWGRRLGAVRLEDIRLIDNFLHAEIGSQ